MSGAAEVPRVRLTRVVIFTPIVRVELAVAPGVGAEEATTIAIASWAAALSGTDDAGAPAAAPWWAQDLHEVAQIVSVELQGASWAATNGTDAQPGTGAGTWPTRPAGPSSTPSISSSTRIWPLPTW